MCIILRDLILFVKTALMASVLLHISNTALPLRADVRCQRFTQITRVPDSLCFTPLPVPVERFERSFGMKRGTQTKRSGEIMRSRLN